MENENAGFEVLRTARRQTYNPALLTAYPPENGDWKREGAQSLWVTPVGAEDLLRQIEALPVLGEDAQHENDKTLSPARSHASRTRRVRIRTVRERPASPRFRAYGVLQQVSLTVLVSDQADADRL